MFQDVLLFVLAGIGIALTWVAVAAVVFAVLFGFGFIDF